MLDRDGQWSRVLDTIAGVSGVAEGGRVALFVDGEPGSGRSTFVRRAVEAATRLGVPVATAGRAEAPLTVTDDPAELPAGVPVTRIELGPLSDDAVADLVTGRLGPDPSPAVWALAAAAGGNPLLLTELVEGIAGEGVLDGADRPTTPVRVREAVRGRLRGAATGSWQLLRVAAVIGRTCRVGDLLALTGQTTAQLLPAVDALLDTGLLTWAGDDLAFRHELVWWAVLDAVPRALRDALAADHRRIVGTDTEPPTGLGRSVTGDVGPQTAPVVADGLTRSAEPWAAPTAADGPAGSVRTGSGPWAAPAGPTRSARDDNGRRAAPDERGRSAGHDAGPWPASVAGDGPRRSAGDDAGWRAESAAADELTRSVALVRSALSRPAAARFADDLHGLLANLLLLRGDGEGARAAAEQVRAVPGERLADEATGTRLAALALARDRRAASAAEAVLAGAPPTSTSAVAAAFVLSHVRWDQGSVDESLRLARFGQDAGVPAHWWLWQRLALADKLAGLRRLDEAGAVLRELRQARELRCYESSLDVAESYLLLVSGRFEEAGALAERGVAAARAVGSPLLVPHGLAVSAAVALHTGDVDTAARLMAEGDTVTADHVPSALRTWVSLVVASHRHGPARVAALAAAELSTRSTLLVAQPGAAPWLVRTATAADDPDLARWVVAEAERLAAANPDHPTITAAATHARACLDRDATALARVAHTAPWAAALARHDLADPRDAATARRTPADAHRSAGAAGRAPDDAYRLMGTARTGRAPDDVHRLMGTGTPKRTSDDAHRVAGAPKRTPDRRAGAGAPKRKPDDAHRVTGASKRTPGDGHRVPDHNRPANPVEPGEAHRHVGVEVPRQAVAATAAEARHANPVPTEPGGAWESFSGVERAIARLVAKGMTNRQIATRVRLSPHTVNYHLRGLFRRLGISSRAELVRHVPASSAA